MRKNIIGLCILVMSATAAEGSAIQCPKSFGPYPLEKEWDVTWSKRNINNKGEMGTTCAYVYNQEETITCDKLALKFGCEPGVRVTKQKMRFTVLYIADESKHDQSLKRSVQTQNFNFYCTGKEGWQSTSQESFKPYGEGYGKTYAYYSDQTKSFVRLEAPPKNILTLNPQEVAAFARKLSELAPAPGCPNAPPPIVVQETVEAEAPEYEPQGDEDGDAEEESFGDWLKRKILGANEVTLDPREVEAYGEEEARRRQWMRDWQKKQDAMSEDDEVSEEEQGYVDWLKERIFGKPAAEEPLNPEEVEIYGEEGARRNQRMRKWKEMQRKSRAAQPAAVGEEPSAAESSAETQSYADWLKEMMFGKPPAAPRPEEVEMYGETGARQRQRQRQWKQKAAEVRPQQAEPEPPAPSAMGTQQQPPEEQKEQTYGEWLREMILGRE